MAGPRQRCEFHRIKINFLARLQVADHQTWSIAAIVASYLDRGKFANESRSHGDGEQCSLNDALAENRRTCQEPRP